MGFCFKDIEPLY